MVKILLDIVPTYFFPQLFLFAKIGSHKVFMYSLNLFHQIIESINKVYLQSDMRPETVIFPILFLYEWNRNSFTKPKNRSIVRLSPHSPRDFQSHLSTIFQSHYRTGLRWIDFQFIKFNENFWQVHWALYSITIMLWL